MSWEGDYQVVRWRQISDVFFHTPQTAIKFEGNAAPIPMSYGPKLDAVFGGTCTQTIRRGRKYAAGQRRWIFEWSGPPYRSKWGRRMLVEIERVGLIEAGEEAMCFKWADGENMFCCNWAAPQADELAAADFIDPPTGVALRDVLKGLNASKRRMTNERV